jgi:hypothetical protein
MNELLMNIHQHVNEMVIEFIKQHLNNELKKIGDEFDISHEDLSRVLNLNTDLYQNSICNATTSLGRKCKYKTHNGDKYCIKHKRLINLDKNGSN